jgi:hypothetical protein
VMRRPNGSTNWESGIALYTCWLRLYSDYALTVIQAK